MFELLVDTLSNTAIMRGFLINMKELTRGIEEKIKDSFFSLVGAIIGAFLAKNKKRSKNF